MGGGKEKERGKTGGISEVKINNPQGFAPRTHIPTSQNSTTS
jgi:hypothetical protein